MVHFYVLFVFDNLRLLIPQHEIRVVEIVDDVELHVEPEEAMAGVMGWVNQGEQQFPVFSLNQKLGLFSYMPPRRKYCVLLETEEEAVLGITCEELISLDGYKGNLHMQPLPACMPLPFSPITALAIYKNEVCCLSSAANLMQYLTAQAEEQMAMLEMTEN